MGLISNVKLALQARTAFNAIEKESKMYDIKVTFKKAAVEFAKSAFSVGGAALLTYFSDGTVIQKLLADAGVSNVIIMAVAPLIHSGIEGLQNYFKHGQK